MARLHVTYANVMSTVAAFLALGGTSYAVASLPKGSVGTRELKAGAVTTDKLAAGVAISGPRGPRGSQGIAGPAGPQGAPGISSDVLLVRAPNVVQISTGAGGSATPATVTLPAGSWTLDALATLTYENAGGSEWFGCSLQSPGTTYASGTARVGGDSSGQMASTMTLVGGLTTAAPVTVALNCAHPSAIGAPAPTVKDVVLRATRVGSVDAR